MDYRKLLLYLLPISIVIGFFTIACNERSRSNDSAYQLFLSLDERSPQDKVIADVGPLALTDSDLDKITRNAQYGLKLKKKIVKDLINRKLLVLAALEEGMQRDPKIITELKNQVESVLSSQYMRKHVSDMEVDEAKITQYYNEHKDSFALPARVSINHIRLKDENQAKELFKKLNEKSITFENAARKFSIDNYTAQRGGFLGEVSKGSPLPRIGYNPELSDAIFSAKEHDIIGPIAVRNFYEIIRVNKKYPKRYKNIKTVRKWIINHLLVSEEEITQYYETHKEEKFRRPATVRLKHILVDTKQKAQEIRKKLLNGADFATLAKKFSNDELSKRSGGDLGTLIENGYLPLLGKDPQFNKAVFALKENEISEPIHSKKGYHIVVVTDKKPKDFSPLEKVREMIINAIAEKKRIEHRKELLAQLEKKYSVKMHEEIN